MTNTMLFEYVAFRNQHFVDSNFKRNNPLFIFHELLSYWEWIAHMSPRCKLVLNDTFTLDNFMHVDNKKLQGV